MNMSEITGVPHGAGTLAGGRQPQTGQQFHDRPLQGAHVAKIATKLSV
jgi:hypothetical protein